MGQAFSSIGDEIYRVGLTWLAVGILKTNTGFINAGQMASLMLVSFLGGKWADRLDPLTMMKRVDLIRALLVLIPVLIYYITDLSLPVLILVAFSVSGLNAFFDPAVQATLPIISKDPATLHDTNGLMSTTTRSARLIGPTIVSFLVSIIPMIHFFTIDAITFLFSAFSIHRLSKIINYNPEEYQPKEKPTFIKSINKGIDLARQHSEIKFILLAKALTAGSWNLAFNLGFALLVHQKTNGDIKSFGFLIASYGLGNLIGSIIFGNQTRKNSPFNIFFGYFFLGFGFFGIGYFNNFNFILICACYAGFMGPLNDLAFIEHLQSRFNPFELPKIIRLRQSAETLVGLILMLSSPLLFKLIGVSNVICCIGVAWILIGLIGSIHFKDYHLKIQ